MKSLDLMRLPKFVTWRVAAAVLLFWSGLSPFAHATPPAERGLGILDELGAGGLLEEPDTGEPIQISANFDVAADGHGELHIIAEMGPRWHVYSLSQKTSPTGGPTPTQIVLEATGEFQVTAPFQPDQPPQISSTDLFGSPLELEEHGGKVTWSAPLVLKPGVDPAKVAIRGRLNGQVCREGAGGSCIPLSQLKNSFVAQLQASQTPSHSASSPATAEKDSGSDQDLGESYRTSGAHVTWQGWAETTAAGGPVVIHFRATPDDGFHVYALEASDANASISKPTILGMDGKIPANLPQVDRPPTEHELFPGEVQRYYEKPFVISMRVEPPAGESSLGGWLGYQTCTDSSCDPPTGLAWKVTWSPSGGKAFVRFSDADYATAAKAARAMQWSDVKGVSAPTRPPVDAPPETTAPVTNTSVVMAELLPNLFFGLLGGLILNLMPCVLPVIGLKILSFVEQAGENRWRVFWLNLVYSAGIIFVFMVLATLVAFARLNWGEQYNHPSFVIAMTGLVFVMALSFLGVWELPIPGFSSRASRLESREGWQGAFFKGVITTILATPCSGPYLGAVLAYVFGKPAYVSYLIFGSIGLGMSLPYLIIGARPQLVKHLPRPGMWMETLKQFMGFVLLAAVVYLFTLISHPHLFVPTLAFLFSLWFVCWWIGRIPITAAPTQRWVSTGYAVAAGAVLGYVSFAVLGNHNEVSNDNIFIRGQKFTAVKDDKILWRAYSDQVLQDALSAGKTVMVEFTANWCLTCKYNLKTAIDTAAVRELLDTNQVAPLLADWRDDNNEQVKAALHRLQSISVPLLAIYPANDPDHPIILRDTITRAQLLESLRKAGPSEGQAGTYADTR